MLRTVLYSAILAPVMFAPVVVSANDDAEEYQRPSYEEAYIAPEMEKLGNCESAALDVFFHDQYIESHSAQFLGQSIETAADCENTTYVIVPRASVSTNSVERVELDAQVEELSTILATYGVDAKINDTQVQEEPDAFLLNGRAAVVKIVIDDDGSA